MPVITCPNCGMKLNAPDSLLGQQVTCGTCRCLFVAHSQTSPSTPSAGTQEPPAPNAAPADAASGEDPPLAPPPVAVGPTGYPVAGGYYQPMPHPTSGYAVASLVLGIAALVTCVFYGVPALICGTLALIFSSKAGKDIRAGTVNPTSAGMAKAGKICGLIGLFLGVLYILSIVLFFVYMIVQH